MEENFRYLKYIIGTGMQFFMYVCCIYCIHSISYIIIGIIFLGWFLPVCSHYGNLKTLYKHTKQTLFMTTSYMECSLRSLLTSLMILSWVLSFFSCFSHPHKNSSSVFNIHILQIIYPIQLSLLLSISKNVLPSFTLQLLIY